ncbi:MAG: ParB/RepB/Spo0J family partition protein [Gammaproteobacteria bacterium]|nr:ParB/RepB/Spo0J family partition protein [Gammaproteobacteria bacterium]MCW5584388.1 ParB/RepB/Spo0J family partition protein [Gammaproteobacteria bacterium]
MSTKKRFTIAPDLVNGLRSTIQSASTNQGQLHYDMMLIDVIESDPANPRKLSLNRQEILDGVNTSDPDYQTKQAELDALSELAESIKRVGVRNAIEVYKEGQKYRIISGERRYLATILLGQKSIPARISSKPDEFNLRYMQWVENINRQDLSLKEKYTNLVAMTEAYQKTHSTEITEKLLQDLIGISSSHAYRYFCLLRADKRIVDLVREGKLNNLKIVQELVSMKDKGAREQIISWIKSSKGEVTSLSNYKAVAGKKAMVSKAINLGKVNNTNIAKYLIDIVLSDSRFNKYQGKFNNIDWSSTKSISKAFQALFKTMENELSTEEA